MKVIFKILGLTGVVGLGALTGCVGLEVQGTTGFDGEGIPEQVEGCVGCLEGQELRGELILLVNTRLTNPASNHTANYPIDGEGRFVGPALYLYDPLRTCDDGGNGCRLAKVGHLWLDESMGTKSVNDGSLQLFVVRDLAWHPEKGLWGLSYDAINDEWGLTDLTVPDWTRSDNHIVVGRYTFLPGSVGDPATDACYWRQSLTGLGFVGDQLLVGAAGKPGNGIDAHGALFSIPDDFLTAPETCIYPDDRTQDPIYYACKPLCAITSTFPEWVGVAGDITDDASGTAARVMARAEDESVMPVDRNALFTVDMSGAGEATPEPMGVTIDGILAGHDVEGLARIGGVLYGVDSRGLVYKITEPTADAPDQWTVAVHDDLSPLFENPDDGLRLRGATRIVIETP
ncbi:MAG: hypothetical protein R3B09_31570 [Nannocystaceae bacterium]